MRKWKTTVVMTTAIVSLLGSTMSASASGLKEFFDADYYSSRYEDLKNAFWR